MTIFLLISIWYIYWTFIPQDNPIPHKFYYIGFGFVMGIGLAILSTYTGTTATGLSSSAARYASLISHIFQARDEHCRPIAIKALESKVDLEEIYAEIRAFDNLDTYALVKKATELGFSYDEVNKLIAEKVSRDREVVVQMMRLTEEIMKFKRSLQNNREKYTEEEIQRIIQSFKDRNPLKGFNAKSGDDKA